MVPVIWKLCRKYVSLAVTLHLFEDKFRNLKLIKFIFVKFKLFFQLTGGSRNTKILLTVINDEPVHSCSQIVK